MPAHQRAFLFGRHAMRRIELVCVVFALGCGGSDSTGIDGGGNDSGLPDDSGTIDGGGGDGSMMGSCDGGLASCNGQCVDTQSDPKNCGGCGVVCNTQCAKGVCQLLGMGCDGGVGSVADNACITVDSQNVYWASGLANGSIWK